MSIVTVKSRIAKLLRMAYHPSVNPHVGAEARRLAYELIAKHNLNPEDFNGNPEDIGVDRHQLRLYSYRMSDKRLLAAIAITSIIHKDVRISTRENVDKGEIILNISIPNPGPASRIASELSYFHDSIRGILTTIESRQEMAYEMGFESPPKFDEFGFMRGAIDAINDRMKAPRPAPAHKDSMPKRRRRRLPKKNPLALEIIDVVDSFHPGPVEEVVYKDQPRAHQDKPPLNGDKPEPVKVDYNSYIVGKGWGMMLKLDL